MIIFFRMIQKAGSFSGFCSFSGVFCIFCFFLEYFLHFALFLEYFLYFALFFWGFSCSILHFSFFLEHSKMIQNFASFAQKRASTKFCSSKKIIFYPNAFPCSDYPALIGSVSTVLNRFPKNADFILFFISAFSHEKFYFSDMYWKCFICNGLSGYFKKQEVLMVY